MPIQYALGSPYALTQSRSRPQHSPLTPTPANNPELELDRQTIKDVHSRLVRKAVAP